MIGRKRPPEVTLENWQELEAYYHGKRTNPRGAHLVARVLSLGFRPHVIYLPGALEAISDRSTGALKSVLPNHVSEADPPNMDAWLWQNPLTRYMLDDAGIPSKTDVFNRGRIIRWGVEAVGTYVNYGDRDLPRVPDLPNPDDFINWEDFDEANVRYEEAKADLEAAGPTYEDAKKSGKRLNTAKMLEVDAFGIYIEGKRGINPYVVQPPKFGYASSILEINGAREIESYPVGTFYREGTNLRDFDLGWFDPVMVVGPPITQYSRDAAEINGVLQTGMQDCLDHAAEMSRRMPVSPVRALLERMMH